MNHDPAFPNVRQDLPNGTIIRPESGISVRDYFAIRALASIIISDVYSTQQRGQQDQARQAYNYADAMMAAREKP